MSERDYICVICGALSPGGECAFINCRPGCPNHRDARLHRLEERVAQLEARLASGGALTPAD